MIRKRARRPRVSRTPPVGLRVLSPCSAPSASMRSSRRYSNAWPEFFCFLALIFRVVFVSGHNAFHKRNVIYFPRFMTVSGENVCFIQPVACLSGGRVEDYWKKAEYWCPARFPSPLFSWLDSRDFGRAPRRRAWLFTVGCLFPTPSPSLTSLAHDTVCLTSCW